MCTLITWLPSESICDDFYYSHYTIAWINVNEEDDDRRVQFLTVTASVHQSSCQSTASPSCIVHSWMESIRHLITSKDSNMEPTCLAVWVYQKAHGLYQLFQLMFEALTFGQHRLQLFNEHLHATIWYVPTYDDDSLKLVFQNQKISSHLRGITLVSDSGCCDKKHRVNDKYEKYVIKSAYKFTSCQKADGWPPAD